MKDMNKKTLAVLALTDKIRALDNTRNALLKELEDLVGPAAASSADTAAPRVRRKRVKPAKPNAAKAAAVETSPPKPVGTASRKAGRPSKQFDMPDTDVILKTLATHGATSGLTVHKITTLSGLSRERTVRGLRVLKTKGHVKPAVVTVQSGKSRVLRDGWALPSQSEVAARAAN